MAEKYWYPVVGWSVLLNDVMVLVMNALVGGIRIGLYAIALIGQSFRE